MRSTGHLDKGEFKILTPMCITCKFNKIGVMKCIQFPDRKPNAVMRCEEECRKYKLDNNYIMASIVGFAIGDALGVPHEFKSRGAFVDNTVCDMDEYGTHNQPRGTWSDDTSLMLALTDAFSEKEYRLDRAALKIVEWFDDGKYTPFGEVFDVGNATVDAIRRLKSGISPLHSGGSNLRDNGNGGLMRVLPAAFYLFNEEDIDKRRDLVYEACGITHNHIISKVASHIYVELVRKLFMDKKKDILKAYQDTCEMMSKYYSDKLSIEELKIFSNILGGEIQKKSVDEISSSGYVIDTLEAVLWCALNTDNYRDAVLKAVNLGDDTDTVAALTGGIAGLAYGVDGIPEEWINNLAHKMFVFNTAQEFYRQLCFMNEPK